MRDETWRREKVECSVCGQMIGSVIGLWSHERARHPEVYGRLPGAEKVPCSWCGNLYAKKGMHTHMVSCRSGPNPQPGRQPGLRREVDSVGAVDLVPMLLVLKRDALAAATPEDVLWIVEFVIRAGLV